MPRFRVVRAPRREALPAIRRVPCRILSTTRSSLKPIPRVAATVWFLAVAWLAFARGAETDYLLVIVTLFFVIFLTLFLFTATYSRGDARWPTKRASFREFLHGTVSTATGDERGRDVLIEIAALPVVLAVGATLIGLAWVIFD